MLMREELQLPDWTEYTMQQQEFKDNTRVYRNNEER